MLSLSHTQAIAGVTAHTDIHALTYPYTNIHTDIHALTDCRSECMYISVYIQHTPIFMYSHTQTHILSLTHTSQHTLSLSHTHTHTPCKGDGTYSHIRTHTHTHTYIHTYS